MTSSVKATWFAATMLLLPAVVAAAPKGGNDGVPPGHQPPAGRCRVWYDGRPPGHQPAITDCHTAERDAARNGGRVLYGSGYDGRDTYRVDPFGADYNCSDRDWRNGGCDDWEARCPDGNGDGWCDYTSRTRYGRLPEMAWGPMFADGRVVHDLRLWLPSPYLEARFRDGNRDGRPEEVAWLDHGGRPVQVWRDDNEDGRADRVVLFRDGRAWRSLQ